MLIEQLVQGEVERSGRSDDCRARLESAEFGRERLQAVRFHDLITFLPNKQTAWIGPACERCPRDVRPAPSRADPAGTSVIPQAPLTSTCEPGGSDGKGKAAAEQADRRQRASCSMLQPRPHRSAAAGQARPLELTFSARIVLGELPEQFPPVHARCSCARSADAHDSTVLACRMRRVP